MIKTMKVAYRDFRCLNCGHVQAIQTNHEHSCIAYCKNCSWKPSFGKSGMQFPFNGRTYRPFIFAEEKPPCEGCWFSGQCVAWCDGQDCWDGDE